MITVQHLPLNHADPRGTIRDIFATNAPDCITVLTSREGAIRGNHYHAHTTQWIYVVTGELYVYEKRIVLGDMAHDANDRVDRAYLVAGDLVKHDPLIAHAYEMTADTVLLAFADGDGAMVRKGEQYEDDTTRVPSIIDEFLRAAGQSRR